MIYVLTNTANPTGYFRTTDPRKAVSVARRWNQLGRLHAIEVMVGGGEQPLRTVRIPLGKQQATVAAIREAMA